MKLYLLSFSPTGGTKKVLQALAEGFDAADEKVFVDLTDRNADLGTVCLQKGDVCLAAVPSFGGRVPSLAAERLGRISGNGALAVAVAVYGNRAYDDTLAELRDILTGKGFRVAAAVGAVAEHSIVREVAAGRPDTEDKEQLYVFGQKICAAVTADPDKAEPALPGNRPYQGGGNGGPYPIVGEECIRCGFCARKCPAGAIPMENPGTTVQDICISCMRCIAVCPKKARKLPDEVMQSAGGWLRSTCADRKENELFL